MDDKQKKDEQQQRALTFGIGIFVIVLCGGVLGVHYLFGVDVSGQNRRFGNINEDFFWLFLVIGVIWTVLAGRSYFRHRNK